MGLMALRALGARPKYDPLPVFASVLKEDYKKLPMYMTSFFPLAYLCAGKAIPPEADRKIQALMVQDEDGYIHDHIASTFHAVHYYRLIGEKTPKGDNILRARAARPEGRRQLDAEHAVARPARDLRRDVRHPSARQGGRVPAALDRAAKWALSCRNSDGGFGHYPGSPSDADAVYFQVATLVVSGYLKTSQGAIEGRAADRMGPPVPVP